MTASECLGGEGQGQGRRGERNRTPAPVQHKRTNRACCDFGEDHEHARSDSLIMSWPLTPAAASIGLQEQISIPQQSPQTTSIPRKRKKSGEGSDDGDEHDTPRGKNQAVKRACNECRQQKVGQVTQVPPYKHTAMQSRDTSADTTNNTHSCGATS